MALQPFGSRGAAQIPCELGDPNSSINFQNHLLAAADEESAHIFKFGKIGTVSKILIPTRTVTTGATLDARLETVSLTDGFPTGTLLDTGANGPLVIGDADDNTVITATLGTPLVVTAGMMASPAAVTIVNPSASFGNLNIMCARYMRQAFPYCALFTGTWAKSASNFNPAFALEYDDGSYAWHPGVYPWFSQTIDTFNSGDTPDEIGMVWQLPFPHRVTGTLLNLDLDGDADIVLYDGTTAVETISLDTNVRQSTGRSHFWLPFDNTEVLAKDTNHRVTVKPGATDLTLISTDMFSAAIMDGRPGGQKFHYTSRTDGGSFTEVTTRRPDMSVFFDAFDDAVGGSGGVITHPGMSGGMRG